MAFRVDGRCATDERGRIALALPLAAGPRANTAKPLSEAMAHQEQIQMTTQNLEVNSQQQQPALPSSKAMGGKKLLVPRFYKFTEEDDFASGCIPSTGRDFVVDISLKADNVEQLLEQIARSFGVEKEHIEIDACAEPGRIDFALTENGDGLEAGAAELERWKAGKQKLWHANYSCYVLAVEPHGPLILH